MSSIQQILANLDTRSLDILQVNTVLSEIARVEAEISLHTEAVLSGRLTQEDQEKQYQQQQQFLTVPMARTSSGKDRRRKHSKESSGKNSTSTMQRSKSLRDRLCFSDKDKGTDHSVSIIMKYYVFHPQIIMMGFSIREAEPQISPQGWTEGIFLQEFLPGQDHK